MVAHSTSQLMPLHLWFIYFILQAPHALLIGNNISPPRFSSRLCVRPRKTQGVMSSRGGGWVIPSLYVLWLQRVFGAIIYTECNVQTQSIWLGTFCMTSHLCNYHSLGLLQECPESPPRLCPTLVSPYHLNGLPRAGQHSTHTAGWPQPVWSPVALSHCPLSACLLSSCSGRFPDLLLSLSPKVPLLL